MTVLHCIAWLACCFRAGPRAAPPHTISVIQSTCVRRKLNVAMAVRRLCVYRWSRSRLFRDLSKSEQACGDEMPDKLREGFRPLLIATVTACTRLRRVRECHFERCTCACAQMCSETTWICEHAFRRRCKCAARRHTRCCPHNYDSRSNPHCPLTRAVDVKSFSLS